MPDSAYAEWLQVAERTVTRQDVAQTNKWGTLSETWTGSSAYTDEASALAEADRVLAFVQGPLVEERLTIGGRFDVSASRGRTVLVTLAGDPDYGNGAEVFCLGGDCDHGLGITHLDVLRRL